jgi:hypothetical protein
MNTKVIYLDQNKWIALAKATKIPTLRLRKKVGIPRLVGDGGEQGEAMYFGLGRPDRGHTAVPRALFSRLVLQQTAKRIAGRRPGISGRAEQPVRTEVTIPLAFSIAGERFHTSFSSCSYFYSSRSKQVFDGWRPRRLLPE